MIYKLTKFSRELEKFIYDVCVCAHEFYVFVSVFLTAHLWLWGFWLRMIIIIIIILNLFLFYIYFYFWVLMGEFILLVHVMLRTFWGLFEGSQDLSNLLLDKGSRGRKSCRIVLQVLQSLLVNLSSVIDTTVVRSEML